MQPADYEKPDALQLQALAAQDRLRLAIAQNIATNARLFSVLIFAAALAGYVRGEGSWFATLAIGAAVPVGLGCIVDRMPATPLRNHASFGCYALSALVTILLLLSF